MTLRAALALGMIIGSALTILVQFILLGKAMAGDDRAVLVQVLRRHQEAHIGRDCGESETGRGCDCLALAHAILADLAAHGIHGRLVTLVRRDARPFPDGRIPAHAVVFVGGDMLDEEQPWIVPANAYKAIYTEYDPQMVSAGR